MKREKGFYWVKFTSKSDFDVAHYDGRYWMFFVGANLYRDIELFEIDERKIIRQ